LKRTANGPGYEGKVTAVTAQLSVPLTIPSIVGHFASVMKEMSGIKNGPLLRNVGHALDNHFLLCADVVEKLEKDGWTVNGYGHAFFAQHPDVKSEDQATHRVMAIGIDPKNVIVSSTWDDWFAAEEKVEQVNLTGAEIMEALGVA
jgi:hypothetical protein